MRPSERRFPAARRDRNVFLSVQNQHGCLNYDDPWITLSPSEALIHRLEKRYGKCKRREVCTSRLYLPHNVRQVLQHRVRGHGENAGHRLSLRARRVQGQDFLALAETDSASPKIHPEFITSVQGSTMKTFRLSVSIVIIFAAGILAGCSGTSAKSPDVSDAIRKSLDQSNLKDVTVSQDRDKGVVTLEGKVTADADKAQAETIAKSFAGTQVVADQIAVLPPGAEKETKAVNADLDDGIEKNLD